MNQNIRTRASLLASWYAAQRVAGANGAVILNHASAAGMLLDQRGGDVVVAIEKCPAEVWWMPVVEYLKKVADDDLASAMKRASGASR